MAHGFSLRLKTTKKTVSVRCRTACLFVILGLALFVSAPWARQPYRFEDKSSSFDATVAPAVGTDASGNIPQPTISYAKLPQKAQQILWVIAQGGPFEFEKDGTVFGNRERLLPAAKRGFYREYTVATRGARGAKRIICSGFSNPQPIDQCYYTSDHYSSFSKILLPASGKLPTSP